MWKAIAVVLVLGVAGHFAIRYLRTNPLGPVIEGREVVVTTQDFEIRLGLDGPSAGTYLVVAARREDWTNKPHNAVLALVDLDQARDYLRSYPELRRYGGSSTVQLSNMAMNVSVIAANRIAYGDLVRLTEQYAQRSESQGERLCVSVAGEALHVTSGAALDDGTDHTHALERQTEDTPMVFAERVSVQDCAKLIGPS